MLSFPRRLHRSVAVPHAPTLVDLTRAMFIESFRRSVTLELPLMLMLNAYGYSQPEWARRMCRMTVDTKRSRMSTEAYVGRDTDDYDAYMEE